MTLDFYNHNARDFYDRTRNYEMRFLYDRIEPYLPVLAHILDAGCGSGRDALMFRQLGYRVTAIDGSAELAALAEQYIGIPVRHLTFDQLDYEATFDAIWANASLLHVPRPDLPDIFGKFITALKPDGIWWMSFKVGDGDRVVSDGRLFTDFTVSMLRDFIARFNALEVIDLWQLPDNRVGDYEDWVYAIVRKA